MKQTILTKLAQLLRVAPSDVEDVLRNDERRARDTVNRRRFMGAAAALASAPFVPKVWAMPLPLGYPDLSFMATIYVSYDNGRTWTSDLQLIPEPDYSYARFKIVPEDWP